MCFVLVTSDGKTIAWSQSTEAIPPLQECDDDSDSSSNCSTAQLSDRQDLLNLPKTNSYEPVTQNVDDCMVTCTISSSNKNLLGHCDTQFQNKEDNSLSCDTIDGDVCQSSTSRSHGLEKRSLLLAKACDVKDISKVDVLQNNQRFLVEDTNEIDSTSASESDCSSSNVSYFFHCSDCAGDGSSSLIPPEWLKPILSPVVVLEDCLKGRRKLGACPSSPRKRNNRRRSKTQGSDFDESPSYKRSKNSSESYQNLGFSENSSSQNSCDDSAGAEEKANDSNAKKTNRRSTSAAATTVLKSSRILPKLSDMKRTSDLSVLPLQVVDSGLVLGTDVVLPASNVQSTVSPDKSSQKPKFCSSSEEWTSSEWDETDEDEYDEWLPPPKNHKNRKRVFDDRYFDEPVSTRAVRFVNLKQKTRPVSKKLLGSQTAFEGYRSKSIPGVQLNAFKNCKTVSTQSTPTSLSAFLSRRNLSWPGLPAENRLAYEDADSGCGDCSSVTSSVVTDIMTSLSDVGPVSNTIRSPGPPNHPVVNSRVAADAADNLSNCAQSGSNFNAMIDDLMSVCAKLSPHRVLEPELASSLFPTSKAPIALTIDKNRYLFDAD